MRDEHAPVFASGNRLIFRKNEPVWTKNFDLHHANTFTVGTNPGWTITDTPLILFEAIFTDHESTGTTPAKLLFLLAAMADIRPDFSFSVSLFIFFYRHGRTSS
jgi:hypothetical protein